MKRLLPCLPALLASCAPILGGFEPRLTATARMEGSDLLVTVTNDGPDDLLLENDCPRPFKAGFGNPPLPPQYQTCLTIGLSPEPWPVGKSLTAYVGVGQFGGGAPSGTYPLTPWAELRVKRLREKGQASGYQTVRLEAPPLTVPVP